MAVMECVQIHLQALTLMVSDKGEKCPRSAIPFLLTETHLHLKFFFSSY